MTAQRFFVQALHVPEAARSYGLYIDVDVLPGPQGVPGPPGPSIPKLVPTSAAGLIPTDATGEQNSDAIDAWRDQTGPGYFASTLVFDGIVPGGAIYNFARPIGLPLWRRLLGGSYGVTLRYKGPPLADGVPFISPFSGGPVFLENLAVTVRDGVNNSGLLDYVVKSHGSLSPNVGGPTVFMKDVNLQFANVANFSGLNMAWIGENFQSFGGPHALLLEGCSESHCSVGSLFGHSGSAIRLRGSGSVGSGITNGGKFTAFGLVIGSAPGIVLLNGIELDGVANCVILGVTVEGASDASLWFRDNTTDCWVFGARSNAGTPALFDGSALCVVYGGCTSTQVVRHINGSRMCYWMGAAESFVAPVDIAQRFGALEWVANIRPDGRILSAANNAPTSGFFEVGQEILRRTPAAGQPNGWRVAIAGDPPIVIALGNL